MGHGDNPPMPRFPQRISRPDDQGLCITHWFPLGHLLGPGVSWGFTLHYGFFCLPTFFVKKESSEDWDFQKHMQGHHFDLHMSFPSLGSTRSLRKISISDPWDFWWFSFYYFLFYLNLVVATQMFFIFTPIWGRFPFWLFFNWVETSNHLNIDQNV